MPRTSPNNRYEILAITLGLSVTNRVLGLFSCLREGVDCKGHSWKGKTDRFSNFLEHGTLFSVFAALTNEGNEVTMGDFCSRQVY